MYLLKLIIIFSWIKPYNLIKILKIVFVNFFLTAETTEKNLIFFKVIYEIYNQ